MTFSPASIRSICLFFSFSIALAIALNEFKFFISVRVPNVVLPASRTDKLTSARIEPSCNLQSDAPKYCMIRRSLSKYAITSSAERISGSDTISINGTPDRLKSTIEQSSHSSCTNFPASSSIWISWIPINFLLPSSVSISTFPFRQIGRYNCDI